MQENEPKERRGRFTPPQNATKLQKMLQFSHEKRRLNFSSLQKACINGCNSGSSQAYPQTWHPAPLSVLGSPWGAFRHGEAFCFRIAAA